jgi:hypothetical protein
MDGTAGTGGHREIVDGGRLADASIVDAGPDDTPPIDDTPLTEQPGQRNWQCGVPRQPSALGISPSGGDERAFPMSDGLHLLRLEGGEPGPGAFSGERVVLSSVGNDGKLGSPTTLAEDPDSTYGWMTFGMRESQARVSYAVVTPPLSEHKHVVQSLTKDGAPDGDPLELITVEATSSSVLVLSDGYVVFAGDRDDTKTDVGEIWMQRLDDAGAPLAERHVIVQASASQPMYGLALQGFAQTQSGFIVQYAYYAVTGKMVDSSHCLYRFQALDTEGRPVGAPYDLQPGVASHILSSPSMIAHDDEVLVTWTEGERMPDPSSPMGWSGEPLWSVIRVGRLDESAALVGPARTVSPAPGPRVWPEGSYWVDLGGDDIGLGWYEKETDFSECPQCWAMGKNYFVILASDVQSARSEVVSFSLQTEDAGFVAKSGVRSGDDILVIGDLSHNLWNELASATLRCKQ